jgi:hypothetical protein
VAWSDQCKISFAVTVRAKRNRGVLNRSVNSVIKEISNESGIPAPTLHRWWADAEKATTFIKNDKQDTTNQNDDENSEEGVECRSTEAPLPVCRNDGCNRPVKIHPNTGAPYTTKFKFHGLCAACVSRAYKEINRNKDADIENGVSVTCPKCGHLHYIKQPN